MFEDKDDHFVMTRAYLVLVVDLIVGLEVSYASKSAIH